MDLLALVNRHGGSSGPGALIHGNAEAGSLNKGSGIYSLANGKNSAAGAVKYVDNMIVWCQGPEAGSRANQHGTIAVAGLDNISVSSTKLITNPGGAGLLGPGNSSSSKALVGPDLGTMDLRDIRLAGGGRMAGIRNGTEAFAVVGNSRAYKSGDDVCVVSSGTGRAGVTGNKVWVNDLVHGEAWAELCECTTRMKGRSCSCSCHCGQTRQH